MKHLVLNTVTLIALVWPAILFAGEDEEKKAGNGPGQAPANSGIAYLYFEEAANREFADDVENDNAGGWTDQGANDLRFIPRGYQYFRNVPFYISDKMEVIGNAWRPGCVMVRGTHTSFAPLQSKPIRVNAAAPYLYFLHTAAYSTPNIHCADYVVHYADNTNVVIPLTVGFEIGEWWEPKPENAEKAHIAWVGQNLVKGLVGFYLYEWKNPHPEKIIRNIVLESKNAKPTTVLIAATASDKKIELGSVVRTYQKSAQTLCEYRQRPKIALKWTGGPADVTVTRKLPIPETSEARQAQIEVVRYRAKRETTVQCTLAGTTKSIILKPDEYRARFLFTEKDVLKRLNAAKNAFDIAVKLDDPDGVGRFHYEANPRQHWIPVGEDFPHGIYAITGIFQVTPFLPVHRYSGYVELRPNLVEAPPAPVEQTALAPAIAAPDWLGADLCLNGIWQWQPETPNTGALIPVDRWENISLPGDVGPEIFKRDKNCIGAWFKKDLPFPADWAGKRIVLRFEGVADFADVFCNGRKLAHHEGILPFEVDLTETAQPGRMNSLAVFCRNACQGIIPWKVKKPFAVMASDVAQDKGHAYRLQMECGAYDQKPDEVEILLDGKNIARKVSSPDLVAADGDGRYFRKIEWNRSILYFSTPGNVPFAAIQNRLHLAWFVPGVMKHLSREQDWRNLQPRMIGPCRDVSLHITGKPHIVETFVKTSVQKMRLDVDLEFTGLPPGGALLAAVVKDGAETVLDLGSRTLNAADVKITLAKPWKNPKLWGPSNPHLYFLRLELTDPQTHAVLDRQFVRFGFREFRIDGTDFVFNGKKPFRIQGESLGAWHLPFHRLHLRWHFADYTQNANINMVRIHQGGMLFPEVVELADEMGMLIQQESNFHIPAWAEREDGKIDFQKARIPIEWVAEQVRSQRNHPAIAMWSAENETLSIDSDTAITPALLDRIEVVLRLNDAIKKTDPTRPLVNNGGHALFYTDKFKDPRVDTVDGHYVPIKTFENWKQRYGKPCTVGEESLGGPFAWSYQYPAMVAKAQGRDGQPEFWKEVNAATQFVTSKIRAWQAVDLAGIWPIYIAQRYHPYMLIWDGVDYGQPTPDIPWPAQSGYGIKHKNITFGRLDFNFFDPKAPRAVHLRTYNGPKDAFNQVPMLEPKFSPEVIVQLLDSAGKPLSDTAVWLIPTNQPGAPFGVLTDREGKAWFRCKPGPGKYSAFVHRNRKPYQATLTPAQVGEWLQVKMVKIK